MSLSTISALLGCLTGFLLAGWALIESRERRQRWAFAAGMVGLSLESLFSYFCLKSGSSADLIAWERARIAALGISTGPWLAFSLSYARGDDELRTWVWRLIAGVLTIAPALVATFFSGDFVVSIRPSEFGFLPTLSLGEPALMMHLLVLAGSVLTLLNLERTYRASVGTLRWRIKFMVLGLSVIMIVRVLTATHAMLFQVLNARLDNLNSVGLVLGGFLLGRAMLRSGHFEIELYPSQSVLKNSVTILIVGGFLTIAGVAAKFVSSIGTDFDVPRAAIVLLIALIVLLVALSSDRVRLWVQQFVSRHFQRPLYDYRSVWRQFTEATRSPRNQEELGRHIVHAMAEVFQAQSVSLWVFDAAERTFRQVASTAQPSQLSEVVRPTADEAVIVQRHFARERDPVDIELPEAPWAEILRRCHPAEFRLGGHRVCTALANQEEVIGLLLVGDRIGSQTFRAQDLDMLKCIGDHVTASLLNVQLSRQLLQARELEAFQTMAAFFVHDLKNAASTLNLMLPNLRTHWDAPGFRDDALRGIGKTVDHINTLVSRLTQLRGELDITPTLTELNPYLRDLLKHLPPKEGIILEQDLHSLPASLIDADQFRKVVTNLVLNAYDATPAPGTVRVTAREEAGWINLTVADTGKGMAPEFIQRSLFKPFQTTKKGGLGIGLFHTRMIVEAHGGRIAAVSQPGQGTTFTVALPIRTPSLPPSS